MNPFTWPGPEFLGFYLVFASAVIGVLVALRRREPAEPVPGLRDADPYAIAVLRDGPREALRIAAASLIERGALEVQRGKLRRRKDREPDGLHRIEAELLLACGSECTLQTTLSGDSLLRLCDPLREQLIAQGLLPGPDEQRERNRRLLIALAALIGVAVIKVWVALATGHRNVMFLILLAIAATAIACATVWRRRTARGDAALAALQQEVRSGDVLRAPSSGFELGAFTGAAAVLGLEAMPDALHPWLREFRSASQAGSSGGGCGSGGSGCGSGGDGGGGGGGGCGGGGCGGGGCGGCGGD